MKKPNKWYYLFENLILGEFFLVNAKSGRLSEFMLDKTMRCTGSLELTEDQTRVFSSGGIIIE